MPKVRKTRSRPVSTKGELCVRELTYDDAICPICMEHPHNAVLLKCSSRNMGCRPYICNTGARHSDCLSHFYKSNSGRGRRAPAFDTSKSFSESIVNCPFCRGRVHDWEVDEPARKCMNSKPKNCSFESCDFSGTYSELRKHVRCDHPPVRPREVDKLSREKWNMMEQASALADVQVYASSMEEQDHEQGIPVDISAANMTIVVLQGQAPNRGVVHVLADQTRGMTNNAEVQADTSSSTAGSVNSTRNFMAPHQQIPTGGPSRYYPPRSGPRRQIPTGGSRRSRHRC